MEITKLQNLASNPKKSVWVSANAGSGKTKILIDRIIKLLLAGVAPSNILCVTYTKAAAAEMLMRLQKIINKWAIIDEHKLRHELQQIYDAQIDDELMQKARNLFFLLHDSLRGISILTIHSFCQDLLNNFPHEAGLNPSFQLISEEQGNDLRNIAKIATWRMAAENAQSELALMLDYLLDNLGEHSLNQWLMQIDKMRTKLSKILANQELNNLAIENLYTASQMQKGEEWQQILHKYFNDDDNFRDILKNISLILQQGSVKDKEKYQLINDFLCAEQSPIALHNFALSILTNEGTQYKTLATNGTLKKIPPQLFAQWQEINKRAEKYFTDYHLLKSVKLSHALMLIGYHWNQQYQQIKQQKSLVDYADLLEKAHELLQNPEVADWILYKLDGKIEHLLIDEAQDTSGLQWQITQTLTAELFAGEGAKGIQSLFVVGDEKQSIFGFQGADMQQFIKQADDYSLKASQIGTEMLKIPLNVSFRSVASILEFVDKIFSDNELVQAISNDNQPLLHHSFRGKQRGLVRIYPIKSEDESDMQ